MILVLVQASSSSAAEVKKGGFVKVEYDNTHYVPGDTASVVQLRSCRQVRGTSILDMELLDDRMRPKDRAARLADGAGEFEFKLCKRNWDMREGNNKKDGKEADAQDKKKTDKPEADGPRMRDDAIGTCQGVELKEKSEIEHQAYFSYSNTCMYTFSDPEVAAVREEKEAVELHA